MLLRAVLAAVALGIIVGQTTLDLVFPDKVVTQGYDPATWKPCPNRKPTKWNKRKAVWYCGPSVEGTDAQPVVESGPAVGQGAASRRTSERAAASRATAARGGR